jgi:hypothetical protein
MASIEHDTYHGNESSASTGKFAALRFPFEASPPNLISVSATGTSTSISSSKSDILTNQLCVWKPQVICHANSKLRKRVVGIACGVRKVPVECEVDAPRSETRLSAVLSGKVRVTSASHLSPTARYHSSSVESSNIPVITLERRQAYISRCL